MVSFPFVLLAFSFYLLFRAVLYVFVLFLFSGFAVSFFFSFFFLGGGRGVV